MKRILVDEALFIRMKTLKKKGLHYRKIANITNLHPGTVVNALRFDNFDTYRKWVAKAREIRKVKVVNRLATTENKLLFVAFLGLFFALAYSLGSIANKGIN